MNKSNLIEKTVYVFAVIIFVVFSVGPILWCLIVSLTPENEMLKETANFFPTQLIFDNYKILLSAGTSQHETFFTALINSLKAVGITLTLGIPCCVMTAYSLSRFEFKGRKAIKTFLLITMMIPLFTTIIPLYKIFSSFGLLDNIFWLSMVYVSSFLPITTWLLCNYFESIPKELEHAALVDGCGNMKIFFKIILPISYPIIFACILIIFLLTWNQFQIPLILASSEATKPLSMIMAEFMTKDSIQYGITAAAGILAIVPPALVAIIFRKLLISGLTQGSVKG